MNRHAIQMKISILLVLSMTLTLFTGIIPFMPEPASAAEVAIEPEADAHVDGGSGSADKQTVTYNNPGANLFQLKEDAATTQFPFTRRIFFRFDLSTMPDSAKVASSKLRVYAKAAATADEIAVYAVQDHEWNETTINWTNKPAHSPEPIAVFTLGTAAGYYEVDITEYLKQQKSAGKASLLLMNKTNNQHEIYSRERPASYNQRPQLVVTEDTSAPIYQSATMNHTFDTATLAFNEDIVDATEGSLKDYILFASAGDDFVPLQAADVVSIIGNQLTITFENALTGSANRIKVLKDAVKDKFGNRLAGDEVSNNLSGSASSIPEYENQRVVPVSADAGVESSDANANTNYGSTAIINLKEGGGKFNRRFYFKFNLTEAKLFNSAKVRLHLPAAGAQAETLNLYAVSNQQWTETGLTYMNQPVPIPSDSSASKIVGQTVVGGMDGWYEWDISAYAKEKYAGDKTISLLLVGTNTATNRTVSTKESGANAPQLLLHHDEEPPQLEGAAVKDQNKTVALTFNEKIKNNKNSVSELKIGIKLSRDGAAWSSLDDLDEVEIRNNELIIRLNNRLSTEGAKVQINESLLKDEQDNVLSAEVLANALTYDVTSPVVKAAGALDASSKALHISADEPLANAYNSLAELKESITYAADGATFEALGNDDTALLSGGDLVVTLTGKYAAGSKIKVEGGSLKDLAGNVLQSSWTSAAVSSDDSAPLILGASVINFNKKVVLLFSESVTTNHLNDEAFKAMVKRSRDGGTSYQTLDALDQVKISGSTITIILNEPLSGKENRFEMADAALTDLSGNIAPRLESGLIASEKAAYPYAPPSEHYLKEAMIDSSSLDFGNLDAASGSGQETMAAGALATLAMAIAAGDRDPAYIERYISTVRKTISIEANMPNLMGGLDSRQQSPLLYAMALLWNDAEIMDQFTAIERSKLITFFKAGLISTAYTLSDFDQNDNPRGAQRIGVNGDTNVWNGGNTNFSEPNVSIFYASSFVLGLENVKKILKEYDFETFNDELAEQGLTSILKSFKSTITYGNLTDKALLMEKIVHSDKWSFKGVALDDYIANPMKLYHATQRYMWSLTAEDGDYIGQKGMAQEFFSTDQAGNRQSSSYVVLGIDPSLLNRILLHYYGFWGSPDNKAIAEEIDGWQKAGVSDYYAKVINGYYSQSWMGTKMEYLTQFKYFIDTMISLGMLSPAIFNDTFSYSDSKPMTDNWLQTGGSWQVEKASIIPYNTKVPLTNTPGAVAVDPEEKVLAGSGDSDEAAIAITKKSFKDVSYLVWVKPSLAGEAGMLARYTDIDNYYLLSMNDGKLAIKKKVDGTMTVLAEKSFAFSANQPYRLKGTFTDQEINLYVNGVSQLSAIDVSHQEGSIGLYNVGQSAKFDGVLVQSTKPDAPVLKSLVVGNGQLTVKFEEVEGAIQYKVKYGTASGRYSSTIITGKTETVIKGLENQQVYYVAVSAETAIGESVNSRELSLAPAVPDVATPVLKQVIADGDHLIISFTTDPKNTSYMIRYGSSSGHYSETVEGIEESGYAIKVKASQVPYYVVVAGQNATGTSSDSNELVGIANSEQLFSDSFTEETLSKDWILSTGEFAIKQSNGKSSLVSAGNNPDRIWAADGMTWSDYRVSAQVTIQPDDKHSINEVYLLGRTTNANHYYLVGFKADKTTGKTYATIRKKVGGAITLVKEEEITLTGHETHLLEAVFNGSSIKVFIDGKLGAEAEDASLASGTAGILAVNAETSFDDFNVQLLNGLEKPVIEQVDINQSTATIKFANVEHAQGYRIKYGTKPRLYTNQLTVDSYSEEGMELADLEKGQTYYITVSAYNEHMESSNANEVLLVIDEGPSPSPGNGGETIVGGGAATPIVKDGLVMLQPIQTQGHAKAVISEELLRSLFAQSIVDNAGVRKGVIDLKPIAGSKSYGQQLPVSLFTQGSGKQALQVRTPFGAVTLPDTMLTNINLSDASQVEIIIGQGSKDQLSGRLQNAIGNKPIVDVKVLIDGKEVEWSNTNAPVTVSIGFSPTSEEKKQAEHIVVWYLTGNNGIERVPSGRYNEATGQVTFKTTHFSPYAVAYEKRSFTDLAAFGWAKKSIEVLASKGIINGVSDSKFVPDASITRADFMLLLVRALNLQANAVERFADVDAGDYYDKELGIAKALGIAQGTGSNYFNPRASITREDMIVLTVRALRAAGYTIEPGNTDNLSSFTDASEAADYAEESIGALIQEGLIEGNGKQLKLKSNTLRAEVAALLYRVYNKYNAL